MTPALLGGTALAVAVLVAAEVRGARTLRAIAKCTASAGFVAVGVSAGLPSGSPAQQAVFAGLVLGAIGDVCLISREKRWFLLGIGAFLLNHVAYVVAFAALGIAPLATAVACVPLGAFAWAVWRVVGTRAGSLKVPVMAYIAVISAMVACAVGSTFAGGPRILLIGASLFFVSDLAVARDRFLAPGPSNKLWGLPTYYAAQLLFASMTPPG